MWTSNSLCAAAAAAPASSSALARLSTALHAVTGAVCAALPLAAWALAAQTITLGSAPILTVGGSGVVAATASSGLPVTLSSYTPNTCTISGDRVSGVSAGPCYILANQAGNASYAAAAQAVLPITVGAAATSNASQTISFAPAPTISVGGTASVAATASSGLPVSLVSYTQDICSISGNTVSGISAGMCYIVGSQAGNDRYAAAAMAYLRISIGQGSAPVCTLTADPAAVPVGGSTTLTANCTPAATAYTWTGGSCAGMPYPGSSTCRMRQTAASATYTVAGSNGAGTGNTASVTVTLLAASPPSCTLSASATNVSPGSPVQLTASCTPAASYYLWSGNTGFGNTVASGTVTPTASSSYSVSGVNAGGTSSAASVSVTVTPAPAPPASTSTAVPSTASTTGLWWNHNESGWGLSISQHGSTAFVAIFTYDAMGQPTWYALPNCSMLSAAGCRGDVYKVSGGSSPTQPWNGSARTVSSAGSATLSFDDAEHGHLSYAINGVSGVKTIEKQSFGNGTAERGTNYTDLWWNAGESGWGIALTQDHGMIFAAWYTYDAGGNPVWYVASACPLAVLPFVGEACAGDLYQVTGGTALALPWNEANKVVTRVGSIDFSFADANNATMSYTINGTNGVRSITRQSF